MSTASWPVMDPEFWHDRLKQVRRSGLPLYRAVYEITEDRWKETEDRNRVALKACVKSNDKILDAGCGWGRLVKLLPASWRGTYVGVDVSPEFIGMARETYKKDVDKRFIVGDLRALPFKDKEFDVVVACSVRGMILRHCPEQWALIEKELNRVTDRVLYLEY